MLSWEPFMKVTWLVLLMEYKGQRICYEWCQVRRHINSHGPSWIAFSSKHIHFVYDLPAPILCSPCWIAILQGEISVPM